MNSIPMKFIDSIGKGECTLFLGAGASTVAGAPTGDELSRIIAKEMFNDPQWLMPLDRCVSLASAQQLLSKVYDVLMSKINDLKPTSAFLNLPHYPWRAIVTTNYDRLVEKAYQTVGLQRLMPVIDTADLGRLGNVALPYVKLHGCISRPEKMAVSMEDYYELRRERQPLFSYIESLHCMGPVIYIGYSFRDTHILDLIYDINRRLKLSRHPILFVTFESNTERAKIESDWFQTRLRGNYMASGFDEFMSELSTRLPSFSGPSRIVPAFSPCWAESFASEASAEHYIEENNGLWECWIKYTIVKQEGWAGINFATLGSPINISRYKKLKFELNIPKIERVVNSLEALNMSSIWPGKKVHFQILSVENIQGKGWQKVTWPLSQYNNINTKAIEGISLADNGYRANLKQEYKVGLRNVEFL